MHKYKWSIATAICFFLIINTSYFWEKETGILSIPFFILLIILYLCFLIVLFIQIIKSWKEKFNNIQRIYTIIFTASILLVISIYPKGIIDFDKLEGKDLLVATYRGTGNCSGTLRGCLNFPQESYYVHFSP